MILGIDDTMSVSGLNRGLKQIAEDVSVALRARGKSAGTMVAHKYTAAGLYVALAQTAIRNLVGGRRL
jgi:hypothetical protein